VVKNPRLSTMLSEVLGRGDILIDHAILPVRDLRHAATSRIRTEASGKVSLFRRIRKRIRKKTAVSGGLWNVHFPSQQENALRVALSEFVVSLAEHDISHTLIYFPRMIEDEEYLFSKLRVPFPIIDRNEFHKVFSRVADINKITVR